MHCIKLQRPAALRAPLLQGKLHPLFEIPSRTHISLSRAPHPHRTATSAITSRISAMTCNASASPASNSSKLLICGPGVLGSYLGKLWLEQHGANTVTGQTNTTANHERLSGLDIAPRLKEGAPSDKFPNVAYCAPPSGSGDYPGDVKQALSLWDGTGSFVFTSSASVYAVEDGSPCTEDSPLVPTGANPRTDALLAAERAVLEAGGCVVRLVGLYHRNRGAHTFFLKAGQVERWAGYTVNLIHYEDAASLCAAVLEGQGSKGEGYRGRIFLGCDGVPVTFSDMMKAIEESGELPGSVTFTGAEGPSKGKLVSNETTREQLEWKPKYGSLEAFFKAGGKDWYSKGLAPVGASHV